MMIQIIIDEIQNDLPLMLIRSYGISSSITAYDDYYE
jgi:hypothetical protein